MGENYTQPWPYPYDQSQQQYLAPPGTQTADYSNYYSAAATVSQPFYQPQYQYSNTPVNAYANTVNSSTVFGPPGVTPQPSPSTFQPSPPGVNANTLWYSSTTMSAPVTYQTNIYPTASYDPNQYYQAQTYLNYQVQTAPNTMSYPTYSPASVPPVAINSATSFSPQPPASVPTVETITTTNNTITNQSEKPITNDVQQTVNVNPNNSVTGTEDQKSKPLYRPIKVLRGNANKSSPKINPLSPKSDPPTQNSPDKQPENREWPESLKDYVQRSFNAAPHNIDAIENELKRIIATKLAEGALYQTDWTKVELPKSCSTIKEKDNKRKIFKSYSRSPDRSSIENDRESQKREKRAKRFQTDKNAKSWGSPSAENDPMINDLDYTIVGTCQNLEKSYLRLTSVCINTWPY